MSRSLKRLGTQHRFCFSLALASVFAYIDHGTASPPDEMAASSSLLRLPMVHASISTAATPRVVSSSQAIPSSEYGPAESLPTPHASAEYRLDMSTALALVAGQNPQVAFARWRIREAYANLQMARALWLPSIQAGVSFHRHDGTLQDVAGEIVDVNRSSLQSGLGAGAVGAGTTPFPGVIAEFQLVDAIFEPRIAQRTAWAQVHARNAVLNDQLLEAAVAYQELLRAHQLRSIALETVTRSDELVRLTGEFAEAGQGTRADADRSRAELSLRRNDVARSEEAVAIASARLAQAISIDGSMQIIPIERAVTPIDIVPLDDSSQEVLATALSNRPELRESQALVAAAIERLRRERYTPLVPSVLLGASYSGFGGGVGDTIERFHDRADFDAVALWRIRNLGYGERSARDAASAQIQQARARQVQVMDQIARDVAEAHALVRTRFNRITVAEAGIQSARDSYQRNVERIRGGQGLPIEVLQAIQSLDATQREWVDAIVDYNVAQFQLQRALGWPIPTTPELATLLPTCDP